MTPRTTFSHSRFFWPRSEKLLLLAMLSMGLLTACVSPPLYDPGAEAASAESSSDPSQPDAASATLTPQPSPSASSETSTPFTFPMATCGDQSAEPSETWYSVFIDGGNINEVRTRYCGDAISTTRSKSGTASVQVASFTSYARALSLAKAIGGVVEQTAQAAPQSQDGYASSDGTDSNGANADRSASNPTPTPQPQPAPQPTEAVQVGQSAYLNAKDSGASINIRQGASTNAQVESMAYAGDRVQVANRVQGDDGYPWYEVRLESGETGWVRGDLLALQTPSYQPDSSYQAPAPAAPSYDQPPINNSQPPNPGYGSQPPLANPPSYHQAPMPQQQQPYPYPSRSGAPDGGGVNGGVNGGAVPYGRNSVLATRDPGTVINIRESASLNSRVRYLANPGDPIQVSGSAQGEDGYTWYQVRFPSGAMGWVRGDLISGN